MHTTQVNIATNCILTFTLSKKQNKFVKRKEARCWNWNLHFKRCQSMGISAGVRPVHILPGWGFRDKKRRRDTNRWKGNQWQFKIGLLPTLPSWRNVLLRTLEGYRILYKTTPPNGQLQSVGQGTNSFVWKEVYQTNLILLYYYRSTVQIFYLGLSKYLGSGWLYQKN